MGRSVAVVGRWSLVVGEFPFPPKWIPMIWPTTNDQWPTTVRKNSAQNCKILLTLRSYCRNILCYRSCSYYKLGGFLQSGPRSARENRSRRNLHGNEKEGKKEETLTVGERFSRSPTSKFTRLSREAPPERLFLWEDPVRRSALGITFTKFSHRSSQGVSKYPSHSAIQP